MNINGVPPDASAAWDIQFTNNGILIPRVSVSGTTDNTTIPSLTTSFLVYNTATADTAPNNVTPRY